MSEKRPAERIAADILIAALETKNLYIPQDADTQPTEVAKMLGDAFRVIYRSVSEPYGSD